MGRSALAPGDPQRLDRYWLAARLGSGGQGVVYEAYDTAGARVAIKLLRAGGADDPEQRGRFAREVDAAKRVAAFCTARVLDADPLAENPYIVSEFIDGPTLRESVERGGPMDGGCLLRLGVGVATALTSIHQCGVVHRDLKPDNVLLGPDGPRVIDFGIARLDDLALTQPGMLVGTPGYMAPELLTPGYGQAAGPQADVFAWGAVMLFAATGADPFGGSGLGEIVERVRTHEPDPGALAEPLRSLVRRSLAKRPELRPTARQILLDLIQGGDGRTPTLPDAGELEQGALSAAAVVPTAGAGGAGLPLGVSAESVYTGLPADVRAAAEGVLLRLVAPGEREDGSEDTVRTARWDELVDAGAPDDERRPVRDAVSGFAAAGLLTVDQGFVRLTYPALLGAWPRLRGWVRESRADLRRLREIQRDAGAWEAQRRQPDALYRGSALTRARAWAAVAPARLRPATTELAFLEAAESARRRQLRLRRARWALTAALLVMALVAGSVAYSTARSKSAEDREQAADRVATVAGNLRLSDPAGAMRFAVAAARTADTVDTRAALYTALTQRERDALGLAGPGRADVTALSADGHTALAVSGGEARTVDTRTGRKSRPVPAGDGTATAAALTPDGRTAAVAAGHRVRLSGARHGGFRADGPVRGLVFGADGTLAVTTARHVVLRDTATGRTRASFPHHDGVALSPDGRTVAMCTEGEPLDVFDVPSEERALTTSPTLVAGAGCSVAFSPDGDLLSAVLAGEVCSWDLDAGHPPLRRVPHDGAGTLAFAPDGSFLAATGTDGISLYSVRDLRTRSGPVPPPLRYPLANDTAVALGLDAGTHTVRYLSGPEAATVRTVDLWLPPPHSGPPPLLRPDGRTVSVPERSAYDRLAFSQDGRLLATHRKGAADLTVWDTSKPRARKLRSVPAGRDPGALAFLSGGERIAVAHSAGIEIRSVRNGAVRATVEGAGGSLLAAGSDCPLLATSSGQVIDVNRRRVVRNGLFAPATALAFHPDRCLLAAADRQGRVELFDPQTGFGLGALPGTDTGSGGTERVTSLAFGASDISDKGVLAVGGARGTLQLWDVSWQRRLGSAFPSGSGGPLAVGFSPDGARLYSAGPGGVVRAQPLAGDAAARAVCRRADAATRPPLSRAEWEERLPETAYSDPC